VTLADRAPRSLPTRVLRAFGSRFAGEVVLPADPGYDAARAVWNGMVDRRPALVVRPAGVPDVASAIRFGREQELPIAVRSGGHSVPGLSTCDGGIVIDLSLLRGVEVDPAARTARVAGGTLLADLDRAAQAHGLVCPVGVVGHTGVAGLTLGGGVGRLQRKLGLTIDSLRAVELVTAEGAHVRASADEHPDLFWGLRGAGANFGVATAFEFDLHELAGTVTRGLLLHPLERATELAAAFREAVETMPDEVWLAFAVGLAPRSGTIPRELAGGPVALVSLLHAGSPADAARDLAGLRAFGPPALDTVEAQPYLVTQTAADEEMAWGHRFSMKSGFLPELPDELVEAAAARLSHVPEGADGGIEAIAWGRAIAAVPDEATAFTGRGAAFWLGAEIVWDDADLDQACREWAREAMADAAPFATAGRYVNDAADTGDDVVRAVYGDAKLERLVALKRAWDPDNVFRLNHNVRP
jgi:FAD/FMN-containing dehydrogenase